MRKYLALMSIAFFCCCSGSEVPEESVLCTIQLSPDVVATKTDTIVPEEEEAAIKNIQVLVFDASGALERYCSYSSIPASITLNIKQGRHRIHAYANCPSYSEIASESQLSAIWIPITRNNALNGFAMWGTASMIVPDQTSATIVLERMVSRITVSSIDVDLGTEAATDALVLKRMYVTPNPTAVSPLGEAASREAEIYCPIVSQGPYRLYAYPSRLQQRLIVEAEFAGWACYYPVDIGYMDNNTAYMLTMNIRSIGTPDPGGNISAQDNDVTVTVLPWSGGPAYNETF